MAKINPKDPFAPTQAERDSAMERARRNAAASSQPARQSVTLRGGTNDLANRMNEAAARGGGIQPGSHPNPFEEVSAFVRRMIRGRKSPSTISGG